MAPAQWRDVQWVTFDLIARRLPATLGQASLGGVFIDLRLGLVIIANDRHGMAVLLTTGRQVAVVVRGAVLWMRWVDVMRRRTVGQAQAQKRQAGPRRPCCASHRRFSP